MKRAIRICLSGVIRNEMMIDDGVYLKGTSLYFPESFTINGMREWIERNNEFLLDLQENKSTRVDYLWDLKRQLHDEYKDGLPVGVYPILPTKTRGEFGRSIDEIEKRDDGRWWAWDGTFGDLTPDFELADFHEMWESHTLEFPPATEEVDIPFEKIPPAFAGWEIL